MAEYKRYCAKNFHPTPPGWNEKYCPICGSRIKTRIIQKPRAARAHSDVPPEERKPRFQVKSPRLSRKIVKPNAPGIFTVMAGKTSVLGPKFPAMSPVLLFLLNTATAGLRSAFWLKNRISSLLLMAKPEEKKIKLPLAAWLVSYGAGAVLAAVCAYGADYTLSSKPFIYALCAFAVSFTVNRYILYWSREVIMDELLSSKLDFIRSRAVTFAPSAIFIWFFGAAYLQAHINRMIKKKGLTSYKPSAGARVKKPPREEASASPAGAENMG
jgi:hypothetical protein